MSDYVIDEIADRQTFSTNPSDHGADHMEFVDFDVEIGDTPVGPNVFGNYGFEASYDVRVVRLWNEGGLVKTIALVGGWDE